MNNICFACQYPWRGQYSCELIQAPLESSGALPSTESLNGYGQERSINDFSWSLETAGFLTLVEAFSWALTEQLGEKNIKSLLAFFKVLFLFKLCNTT